jgi:hypothetical protein
MNFKLINKNNVGAVLTLLLAILLSQSKIFNFLIEIPLGRAILIFFILAISYCNKILGVFSVLLIIIMFNNSNISYMEGFTDPSNNISTDISNNTVYDMSNNISDMSNNVSEMSNTVSDMSNNTISSGPVNANSQSSTSTQAQEGFDIIGTENNIKRGKQSNSIPVNDFMRESKNISPYEGSKYSSSYHSL